MARPGSSFTFGLAGVSQGMVPERDSCFTSVKSGFGKPAGAEEAGGPWFFSCFTRCSVSEN